MERVSTLIKKLQQQLDENASANKLLHTVQMLQAELQSVSGTRKEATQDKVSVISPLCFNGFQSESPGASNPAEEKIVEVLQVDEKAIEEELEQIKRNAEAVNSMVT